MTVTPGLATLKVQSTTPSDTGRYAVELTNEFGKDRMFSSVTIEGTELLTIHASSLYQCIYFLCLDLVIWSTK